MYKNNCNKNKKIKNYQDNNPNEITMSVNFNPMTDVIYFTFIDNVVSIEVSNDKETDDSKVSYSALTSRSLPPYFVGATVRQKWCNGKMIFTFISTIKKGNVDELISSINNMCQRIPDEDSNTCCKKTDYAKENDEFFNLEKEKESCKKLAEELVWRKYLKGDSVDRISKDWEIKKNKVVNVIKQKIKNLTEV